MIYGIAIFIITICIDVVTDFRLWQKGEPVNHKRGFLLRLIGLIPAIILIGWQSLLLVCALYWLLFDGCYNMLRRFKFWFTGSDDKDDARTDNFLQRLKLWQHITIKLGLVAIGILVYIFLP